MNEKRTKYSIIVVLFGLLFIFLFILLNIGKVRLNPGDANVMHTLEDSIMLEGRHMGYVNMRKFIDLSKKLPNRCFTNNDYNIQSDSIAIKVNNKRFFYGIDGGANWIHAYKNIPIHITEDGFKAAISEIDSIEYIYIPYQVLSSVANHVNEPKQNINHPNRSEDNTPNVITIRNKESLPLLNSSIGKKIQTEGYVLRNVSDILSSHPGLSQVQQMECLWKYVRNHWNYVHDPAAEQDTWRSASETIENYYFVNGQCYTGDCDDFAILMASFARQIGYHSHLVTAFNNEGGHAYAEFSLDKKKWIPLDWFSDAFGGKPFNGTVYRVYEDL